MLDIIVDFLSFIDAEVQYYFLRPPKLNQTLRLEKTNNNADNTEWRIVLRISCTRKTIKNVKLMLKVDLGGKKFTVEESYPKILSQQEIIKSINLTLNENDVLQPRNKIKLNLIYEFSQFGTKTKELVSLWVIQRPTNINDQIELINLYKHII